MAKFLQHDDQPDFVVSQHPVVGLRGRIALAERRRHGSRGAAAAEAGDREKAAAAARLRLLDAIERERASARAGQEVGHAVAYTVPRIRDG